MFVRRLSRGVWVKNRFFVSTRRFWTPRGLVFGTNQANVSRRENGLLVARVTVML